MARASRVPVLPPETGAHLGYRSPCELRDNGRVSLTFTLFAGFGGTALGRCQVAKDDDVGFSRFEPPSRLGEADVDHAAT